MMNRRARAPMTLLAASLALLAIAAPARAIIVAPIIITASQGQAELGVAPMQTSGASATFAHNSFTGNNDILLGPGQGYPAADLASATVVASAGPSNSPVFVSSPPVGAFGGGAALVALNGIGVSLNDTNAPGTASFAIASSITTFKANTNYGGSLGAYVGVSGNVPTTGSFTDLAVVLTVSDTNASSPLFGTKTYTILVGDQNTGGGNFNPLASAQFTSFTQTGTAFRAAGIDIFSTGSTPLQAGDTFTVAATLTAYVDPASINTIDISNFPDLFSDLPTFATTIGLATVPEPASFALLGGGFLGLIGTSAARRARRARAA